MWQTWLIEWFPWKILVINFHHYPQASPSIVFHHECPTTTTTTNNNNNNIALFLYDHVFHLLVFMISQIWFFVFIVKYGEQLIFAQLDRKLCIAIYKIFGKKQSLKTIMLFIYLFIFIKMKNAYTTRTNTLL